MCVQQAFSFLSPLMDGQPAPLEGMRVGNRNWGQELCPSCRPRSIQADWGVAGMFRNHADRVVR